MVTGLFIGAIAVIGGLLWLRAVEERRGARYASKLRSRADLVVIEAVGRLEYAIRAAITTLSRKVVIGALKRLAMSTVSGLHRVEERLISWIEVFRGKHHTALGSPSPGPRYSERATEHSKRRV